MKTFYAADGSTNWCLPGPTILGRTEILQDPAFQRDFTSEKWRGVKCNIGHDGFLKKWVLFNSQGLAPASSAPRKDKYTPEQAVEAGNPAHKGGRAPNLGGTGDQPYIRPDGTLWSRQGLQTRIKWLFDEPGYSSMRKSHPYLAWKMVEDCLTPLVMIVCIFVCLVYLFRMLADILDFVTDYPYCWVHFWVVPFIRLWPYSSDVLVLFYGLDDEVWSNRDLEGSHHKRHKLM
ncbi:hypothetical protein VM1G_09159 [Cytospora mali]|uniref:Uncharacterized protein n=1 Tax=Cytospora mali TaxID=578113 RepID=A0A194WBD5_CYTMA|nr:hypothetical protein VM1G_09159 [Valsa mali]